MNTEMVPTLKRMPLRQQKRIEVGDYWFYVVDKIISEERAYEIIRGEDVLVEFSYDPLIKKIFAKYKGKKSWMIHSFVVDWRLNYTDIIYHLGKQLENFVYSLDVDLMKDLIMDEGNVVDIPPFTISHKVYPI